MRDRWINLGYEDRELKPYREAARDVLDTQRIGKHRIDTHMQCLLVKATVLSCLSWLMMI